MESFKFQIRGKPASVEDAKNAILKKKAELEAEREEMKLKSYEEKVCIHQKFAG